MDDGELQHDIPVPPPTSPLDSSRAESQDPVVGPYVANPFVYEPPTLGPGQLAAGWKSLFIAGWVGVLVGFGCIWQAGRVAGIAPWWLGPETNPRFFLIIALPFLAPLLAIAVASSGSRWAVYVGIAAGFASVSVALGDVGDYPGLAAGEAAIGIAGLFVSVACFAGRMRRPPETPITLP